MKKKHLFLFLSLTFFLNCHWMSENQIETIYGEKVYSRSSVIEKFQISALTIKQNCSNAENALNYMINEGFADELTKSFYIRNNVDACIILFLALDCPTTNDLSTNISFYKNFIYNCKLKSPN